MGERMKTFTVDKEKLEAALNDVVSSTLAKTYYLGATMVMLDFEENGHIYEIQVKVTRDEMELSGPADKFLGIIGVSDEA